jgi:hypothetical protein
MNIEQPNSAFSGPTGQVPPREPSNSVLSPQSSALASDASVLSPQSSVLSFAIPASDLEQFARLPDAVRTETSTTLLLLRQIHYAKSKSAEARAIAAQYKHRRGFSDQSLLRKYYAYLDTGDWRTILDRAKCGPAFWNTDTTAGLPRDFIEFWKSLCERNQRKTAPARRELIRIWQTGKGLDPATGATKYYKKFPGYPNWSPSALSASPRETPSGWSAANLNRHAPSKFELAVARIGREAASQFRRKVHTTRRGLAVGQYYLFDDLEYDKKVNFPGNRIATKPLGLVGLDLFAACFIALGFKPTLIDLEGAKKKLRERDMLWLVADALCSKGFRTDERGTTLVVEHGTAAIRGDFEERILAATGGKVTVDRSGLSSEHLPGFFDGASKGNPRFKAALESMFNVVHNEGAALPGNTGMDRAHAPTENVGLERYNTQLLKLAETLPAHRRELLQYPVLSYHQFVELTLDIYKRLNERTEHDLEGWEKCGHIQQDYFIAIGESHQRFSQEQWLALPSHQRAALKDLVQSTARKLSPQEVWNRHANELQKLSESALPILLGPDFGEERQVKSGYITFENRDIDSDIFRFPAAALSPQSSALSPNHILPENSKFLTYHSPHQPDRLILTDAKGRYVTTLERQIAPCRADAEAVRRQLAAAKHEEAARIAPVAARATPLLQARVEMHRHNLEVFEGQPITPAEIQSAQDLRARLKKVTPDELDTLVGTPAPAGRGLSGNVGCNDPLPPSAQETPEASEVTDSDIDQIL